MPTTVLSAFETLLDRQRLTDDQKETAAARVRGLTSFFNNNFEMNASPFTVGSYDRGTICAGERDIDLMAPFAPHGSSGYWNRYQSNSRTFLYWVRDYLNNHYAATKVSSRQVSVKLDFTKIVTDVTPCFPRQGEQ